MSHSDSNFFKPFAFVLGALVIFTLFIGFVANMVSPDGAEDPLAMAVQKKFIEPVGRSRVADNGETAAPAADAQPAVAESPAVKTAAESEADLPEETATETAEAETPAATDTATEAATETDMATETETATAESAVATTAAAVTAGSMASGDISMKVKATVATNCAGCHNAGLNGAAKPDDASAWAALADKGVDALTASVINGKGKMPARAESSLDDEEIGQAVQLMISKATGKTADAASASGGATESADKAPTVDTSETAVAATAATAEASPEIKQVVDTTCAACHLTGIASAPKFGDKAAWDKRLEEKGIDGLVASAIAGVGIMPPKGGSALDEEQLKLAIEYMMSK